MTNWPPFTKALTERRDEARLFDGVKATTNKLAFPWVQSQKPSVLWQPQARWVEDGKFVTSSGISAGIDMSLAVRSALITYKDRDIRPMTVEHAIAFAGAMALWAALPGPGLAAVVSRTLGSGPRAGFAVIVGLVIADVIYMVVAVVGLVAIATTMGPLFEIVKYVAAAYLVWRGYRLFVGKDAPVDAAAGATSTGWRDIGFGALITLSNPKAILFFGAVVPAFFDMTAVGFGDFVTLIAIVGSTSFLVYGSYIGLTDRVHRFVTSTRAVRRLRQATGVMLVASGFAVATR